MVLLSQMIRTAAITGRTDTIGTRLMGRQGGRWAEQTVRTAIPTAGGPAQVPPAAVRDPAGTLRELTELVSAAWSPTRSSRRCAPRCRLAGMTDAAAPVLIAYDGSEVSQAAVRHAAELFAGRPAVVATVWEPGMAAVPVGLSDAIGAGGPLPDPATVEAVDQLQNEHAVTVAGHGAELARSLGLAAEPQAVPDEVDVVDTLIGIAQERGAAASDRLTRHLGAALAPARKRFAQAARACRPAGPGYPRRIGALRGSLGQGPALDLLELALRDGALVGSSLPAAIVSVEPSPRASRSLRRARSSPWAMR